MQCFHSQSQAIAANCPFQNTFQILLSATGIPCLLTKLKPNCTNSAGACTKICSRVYLCSLVNLIIGIQE